jgi:hypothetical protein
VVTNIRCRFLGNCRIVASNKIRCSASPRQSSGARWHNTKRPFKKGFRDVSDALVQYQKVTEIRPQRGLLVTALQDRKRLAYMRYRGEVDTLLNALDADRDLFDAELSLSQIRLGELLSLVQLYKALGGGWQE